jgi:peptide/nickel transport system substrate-binding protein
MDLSRRTLLTAAAALPLAAPAIAAGEAGRTLKFIPHADLAIVDPSWSLAYITRNHAMLVFDTLYGTDAANVVSPQMLEGHKIEDDGKTWLMTLRPGLTFHGGTPVLARDCVASVRRWTMRDNYGQTVAAVTDELAPVDDRTLRFRLKRPFPLLAAALGKPGSSVCAIMPERLAGGDKSKPITEVVGSGPFRFKADERVPGALVVYERNPGYVPREFGEASRTAGPKRVYFDRVEWHVIPEAATAAAALQAGEVDWWEAPSTDLWASLRADKRLTVSMQEPTGLLGFLRMNQDIPPFNNPAIRRAVVRAVNQKDFMQAVAGDDPAMWHTGVGFFCPGSPMESEAGMTALNGKRDLDAVRAALKSAGYAGETIAVMVPTDIPLLKAYGDVGVDMLSRAGFTVDAQYIDWGTVVQRNLKPFVPGQSSWHVYHSAWAGLDQWDPAVNTSLRANGKASGRPGVLDSPKLEGLRDAWLAAPDLAEQKRLAREIQLQAFEDVPYIPIGQSFSPTAYRRELSGLLSGYPLFWSVRRG